MFLLDTEMFVALRGWTNLNTTVCCPRLLTPIKKGLQSALWKAPLLGLKTKLASSFYNAQTLSSVLGNASEKHSCGRAPLTQSGNQEKSICLFSVLGIFSGTSDSVSLLKGTLCSPARASPGLCQAFPAFPALPALLSAHSVTRTPPAAFEAQGTACVWPDIVLCSAGQLLLASQQIQVGWIWLCILNAEEIKLIHVVLIKNFNLGRLVSVCVFWEPH